MNVNELIVELQKLQHQGQGASEVQIYDVIFSDYACIQNIEVEEDIVVIFA